MPVLRKSRETMASLGIAWYRVVSRGIGDSVYANRLHFCPQCHPHRGVRMLKPGDQVVAMSASEGLVERRAVSAIVDGSDFPVVWLCTEIEWQAARSEKREPSAIPWPAEDVRSATASAS